MAAIPRDDPNKLSKTFADQPLSAHGSHWHALWQESFTPWDRGGPSAALAEVLAAHPAHFAQQPGDDAGPRRRSRPKALVPGCGQGHDVLLLSRAGFDVVGLDYSDEAIRRARANDEAGAEQRGEGPVTWAAGDFWADEFLESAGVAQFDLIFDYTVCTRLSHGGKGGQGGMPRN